MIRKKTSDVLHEATLATGNFFFSQYGNPLKLQKAWRIWRIWTLETLMRIQKALNLGIREFSILYVQSCRFGGNLFVILEFTEWFSRQTQGLLLIKAVALKYTPKDPCYVYGTGLCLGMKKNRYGQSDGSLELIWEVNYSTVIFASLTTVVETIETSVGYIWPFYTWFTFLHTTLVETADTRFGWFSATNWKWSQGSKVLFKAWDNTTLVYTF